MKKILTTTFRSLSVRNFRLFAGGQVVSVAGTWMMVVSQDWLVLGMTDDSGTALGLVTALQFTPLLLLTLYGGKLADRYDKRLLLTVSNVISGVFALALGLLVVTDAVELWHVYLFALALGTVNAVEVPTRMAFVSEMVGADLLPNASALSAAYFNVARVVGPAVAGLLITAWGTGPVMLINAVSYLGTVVGLRMMRPAELLRDARQSARGGVLDGLRYMRSRPDLMLPISLVAVIGLFGLNFQLTVPLIAKTVFDADATSFGLLTTSLAAGSLIAAFAATGRRGRPSSRTVIGAALAFGVTETLTGWAPTYGAAVVLMALTGFTSIYFAQAANHRIQLGSDPQYRGRVLALYTLILQGSTPLGAIFVGWLSELLGARSGLYVGGLVSLTAALAATLIEARPRPRPPTTPTEEPRSPATRTPG
ncbi:MFS transporter [Streptomyces sp. NBC_01803]|uniref:MFS transporter n=1 Tax=Streptomyces sp. NBC_01803 TaxID=2975946 RepID=UPI002DD94FE6|nr:MFS transporter [Streptomyces sp. NBC_01803]WSA47020.1 MFS transporter [Streptomyces sp. NBC_01803]